MLPSTVMCGYSAYSWNTMAMSRSRAGNALTTRSPMEMSPDWNDSSPATMRKSVDLPQPEGPTKTTNSPGSMSSDRPWMTSTSP